MKNFCRKLRSTISRVGMLVTSVDIFTGLNQRQRAISFLGWGEASRGMSARKTWCRLLSPPNWNRYTNSVPASDVSSSSSRRAASIGDSSRFIVPPGNDHRDRVRATRRTLSSRLHTIVALSFMLSPERLVGPNAVAPNYESAPGPSPVAKKAREDTSLVSALSGRHSRMWNS